jgi:hemin uptake protein HemP
MNQSTPAMAMNAAAPIAASPFMVISGESRLALVAEDHPVLASCRIIGADQRVRVSCDHGFGQRYRLRLTQITNSCHDLLLPKEIFEIGAFRFPRP